MKYYLRVRLQTSRANKAGTDGDIKLRTMGETHTLDYLPGANPIIAYNDFERGDDQVYTVGPFRRLPSSINLFNDAPDAGDILRSLLPSFKVSINLAIGKIGRVFQDLTSSRKADHIGTHRRDLTPEVLRGIIGSRRQDFNVTAGNRQEGRYAVTFTVQRLARRDRACTENCNVRYRVRLKRLICIRESKWDRGSNSDEPFVIVLLANMQGGVQQHMVGPFDDVDTGESRDISHLFDPVEVNPSYGGLSLIIKVMESDDENRADRVRLLNEFAGTISNDSAQVRQRTSELIGNATGADWKLGAMSVFAFTRGPRVEAGYVYGDVRPRRLEHWLDGGQSRDYQLDARQMRLYLHDTRILQRAVSRHSVVTRRTAPLLETRPPPSRPRINTTPPRQVYRPAPIRSTRAGQLRPEKNTDYYGGDYTSFVPKSPSWKHCSAACSKAAKCVAYTYVRPSKQSPQGRCYLKSKLGKRAANKCCISGRR